MNARTAPAAPSVVSSVTLRARLTFGLAALTVIVGFLLAGSVVGVRQLGHAVGTILRENYVSVIACEDMNEALERLDSAALFSVSGRDDIAKPIIVTHRRAFSQALAREQNNITLPGEDVLVAQVTTDYADYVATVDRALADPASRTHEVYFRDLLPRFTRLKESIHTILRMNQANMEETDHSARLLASSLVQRGVVVTLIALAIAVWLVVWLPRAVLKPLDELRATAIRIGDGDLDVTVGRAPFRELVPLAEAFGTMLARLRAYRQSSLGELLAAKDLARSTVACLDDPVLVYDDQGTLLLTNAAAELAFGVAEGSSLLESDHLPPEVNAAANRVLATREPVRPSSLAEAIRVRMREGERFFLVRAAALASDERERTNALVLLQDVTRYRKIDELKSNVVATVSHEFKTPLTSLRMATHLLLEPQNGPLTESQRELVLLARDDTERLRQLVESFLDLSRIEAEAGALRPMTFDLVSLLRAAAEAHRQVATQKGVTLHIDPPGQATDQGPTTELVAQVDPEKMAVAIANLVANAVRHTPFGGTIHLRAEKRGTVAVIEVEDSGEGIAAADLPHIFERFHTAGVVRDAPRAGLGLSIAREIVQQHGGELHAESTPGHGARFSIDVPIQQLRPLGG